MITTDNLEEYHALMCLKNFCNCANVSPDELEIELEKQMTEVITYEKI